MPRRPQIALLVASVLLVAAIALYGRANSSSLAPPRGPAPIPAADRKAAPALAGTTLGGGRVDLASYRGKVVVVTFFAPWCYGCRVEAPALRRIALRYPSQVRVLAVAMNTPTRSSVRAFQARYGWTWPIVFDPPGELGESFYGAIWKPTTFVVDASGRIAWKQIGTTNLDALDRAVTAAVGT
jgi:peroxiredoxin